MNLFCTSFTVIFSPHSLSPPHLPPEGRGNDKLTPVLFSVNHANGQSNDRKVEGYANSEDGRTSNNFLGSGSGRGARGQAIRSPSSLLSAIRNSSAEEQQNIDYTVGGTNSVNTENRQGMEVISGNCHGGGNNTLDSNSSSSSRTSKMAMTKGFLDSAKVRERPIYPASGSVEGSGGSRGGSLARVMDKCLVINPSSLSQEQSRRASENSSGSSRVGSNAHSDISSSSTNAVSGVTEVSHVRTSHFPPRSSIILRVYFNKIQFFCVHSRSHKIYSYLHHCPDFFFSIILYLDNRICFTLLLRRTS